MTLSRVDAYLQRLRRELLGQFIADPRIIEEVRGHLVDAVERAQAHEDSDTAELQAIERFGSPELVAAAFVAGRTRPLHRRLLVTAVVAGMAIARVDALPSWDDTGITAGALAAVAAVLALLGPQRPWLWTLAVGIWIPTYALVSRPDLGTVAMFLVLVFPLAGAYVGRITRGYLTSIST